MSTPAPDPASLSTMPMPSILYGTAWKGAQTTQLVLQALRAGFRGVDTAGQRKHYREDLVGLGLAQARAELGLSREDVWIQSKFTSIDGQDEKGFIPYDPSASVSEQVRSSFLHSLRNLHNPLASSSEATGETIGSVNKGKARERDEDLGSAEQPKSAAISEADVPPDAYLDSYLLHSPLRTLAQTAEAWRVLEDFVAAGRVRYIGISNCYDARIWNSLRTLPASASSEGRGATPDVVPSVATRVAPSILQNRWHGSMGHDVAILPSLSPILCPNDFPIRPDGTRPPAVRYQPFWLLTGNPFLLDSTPVLAAAAERSWTPEQVLYRFAAQGFDIPGVEVTVLSGTTNEAHMREAVIAVSKEHEDLDSHTMEAIRKEVYGE